MCALPPAAGQNDITELFSLCNFVMPEIFGDREPFNFVYQKVRRRAWVGPYYNAHRSP